MRRLHALDEPERTASFWFSHSIHLISNLIFELIYFFLNILES